MAALVPLQLRDNPPHDKKHHFMMMGVLLLVKGWTAFVPLINDREGKKNVLMRKGRMGL